MKDYTEISETIEAYVRGRLSDHDKQVFEAAMQGDPGLKSEVRFQKSVIHQVEEVRKSQLKARLQKIPAGAHSGSSYSKLLGTKAVVAITATVVTLTGLYYIFSNHNSKPLPSAENVSSSEVIKPVQEPVLSESADKIVSAKDPIAGSKAGSGKTSAHVTSSVSKKAVSESKSGQAPRPVAVPQDQEEIPAFVGSSVSQDPGQPDSAPSGENNISKTNEVEISNIKDLKNKFHYRYFGKRLFLHGNFDAGPYELLEFNKNSGSNLFLYYNNQYFELNDDQKTVAPLNRIKDENLIKDLEKARANR